MKEKYRENPKILNLTELLEGHSVTSYVTVETTVIEFSILVYYEFNNPRIAAGINGSS